MSLLLKDVLSMAEARFIKEGIETARLDAEMLFSFLAGKDKAWQFLNYGKEVDEDLCESYFKLVDERGGGRPLQYIVGSQEFMGLTFLVNEDVLIPRQDTELLVEKVLEIIKAVKKRKAFGILDLCCGSGAIAVSLAYHLKQSDRKTFIVASDISEKALAMARENAKLNQVEKLVEFAESDLFDKFSVNRKGRGKRLFDIIASNPPYIPTDEIKTLMREVRNHEPLSALDGGYDGLDFYREIINQAGTHLKDEGLLMLEIGHNQGEVLSKIARNEGIYEEAVVLDDHSGHHRLLVLSLKGRHS